MRFSAAIVSCLALMPMAQGQSVVTFDFDTGTPALIRGQSIPLSQTAGGMTAQFSSPQGTAFAVQSDVATGWKLPKLSGNYLSPTGVSRSTLSIKFSQPLGAISLMFATADTEIEVPSTIQLTAYMDANTTPAVGTASTHATYAGDTFPTSTLNFDSGGKQFNLVEVALPFRTGGTTSFVVDTIRVTPYAAGGVTNISAASYASGAGLAPGSIASMFGQALATGTAAAETGTPPTTLANTTVRVRDSAGTERQAGLFFVGPTQINYVIPEGTALGIATATVTSGGQTTATGGMVIDAVAPGLFTANFDGKGAPAASAITVAPDQSQTVQAVATCGAAAGSCVTAPINLGPAGTQVVLTLYGTGIRGRSALAAVTARIGGTDAEVQYAGAQPQFVGLDQVNVTIPRSLAGRGEVDLAITVGGKPANLVKVNVR